MAASRKSGGSNVAIALSSIKRRSGGGWTTATIAKRRSGGTWVDIFNAIVSISDQNLLDSVDNPSTAVVTYSLPNTGGGWLTGGTPSDYEAQAVETSKTLDTDGSVSGTLSTWLNLGTTREWSLTQVAGLNSRTSNWTIQVSIRRASDGVVLDTATINMTCETIKAV